MICEHCDDVLKLHYISLVPELSAEKPNYEVGSAAKLSFAKKPAAVWKLGDDDDDEDNELINADDLLDEEDKVKPDPTNLKGKIHFNSNVQRSPRNKTIRFSMWNNWKKEGMQRLLLRFS